MSVNPSDRRLFSLISRYLPLLPLAALLTVSGCALLEPTAPEVVDAPPAAPVEPQPDPRISEIQQQLASFDERLQSIQGQLTELKNTPPPMVTLAPAPRPPAPIKPVPVPTAKSGMHSDGKTLVGKVEWLWIQSFKQSIPAEMNTGTPLSFIHVSDLNLFERDGNRWANFSVDYSPSKKSREGQKLTLDTRVERMSRTRAFQNDSGDSRPVIKLPVRLGNLQQVIEFVLTDQSLGKQPIALGRNFLKDMAVVDVSEQYIQPKYEPVAETTKENSRTTAASSEPDNP